MPEAIGQWARVLIVDDEAQIRAVLEDFLCAEHDCRAVGSAEEALELLRAESYDLILSDINLGGISGLEMAPQVLALAPDTAIIMISAVQTVQSAVEALRAGVSDYIIKPFDLKQVEVVVGRALELRRLRQAKKKYEQQLEETVAQRTAELGQALGAVEDAYRATLKALAAALETRDQETHGHSERVISFSLRLGRELALSDEQLRALEFGALLHDIGKIGVPDAVLRKPASLTDEEWRKMRAHPALGQQILRGIEFLDGAAHVVGEHHEKWDGTGYPRGLRGEEIDLNARIFAVADAFDAMISDRVYRQGTNYEAATRELERNTGKQFDPQVVAAFIRVPPTDWDVLRQRSLAKDAAKDTTEISSPAVQDRTPTSALRY